jgi:8-oxo-dGTP diphosphatase
MRQAVMVIIRREREVLLVQQLVSPAGQPQWMLPNGDSGPGESLELTLRRVVREQSGLAIQGEGLMVQVVRLVNQHNGEQAMTYLFELAGWDGELSTTSNGKAALPVCRFNSLEDTVAQMQKWPQPSLRDPLVAYLLGEIGPGFVWLYRYEGDRERLVTRLRSSSLK